jgi:hypothetical protein
VRNDSVTNISYLDKGGGARPLERPPASAPPTKQPNLPTVVEQYFCYHPADPNDPSPIIPGNTLNPKPKP